MHASSQTKNLITLSRVATWCSYFVSNHTSMSVNLCEERSGQIGVICKSCYGTNRKYKPWIYLVSVSSVGRVHSQIPSEIHHLKKRFTSVNRLTQSLEISFGDLEENKKTETDQGSRGMIIIFTRWQTSYSAHRITVLFSASRNDPETECVKHCYVSWTIGHTWF